MKSILKWILGLFVGMVILTNFPILNSYFMSKWDGEAYFRYSNSNASFTFFDDVSFKSGALTPEIIERFIEEENPKPANQTLYRVYRINPLCFWRWSYYFGTSSDFQYKSWKEIEPNRVPYDPENKWQDF